MGTIDPDFGWHVDGVLPTQWHLTSVAQDNYSTDKCDRLSPCMLPGSFRCEGVDPDCFTLRGNENIERRNKVNNRQIRVCTILN